MITRAQLYGKEATSILRDISTYHSIHHHQLLRLYPDEEKTENLLRFLLRQRRIYYNGITDCYHDSPAFDSDAEMLAAIWVLADFGNRVDYHNADDLPVKLVFFAEGEVYEVIYIAEGKEALICHALSGDTDQSCKRLVITQSTQQMEELSIDSVAAYCLVDAETGQVQYFKPKYE